MQLQGIIPATGERIADELLPALRSSLDGKGPSLIDCPIDFRENEKLSQALGEVICQG